MEKELKDLEKDLNKREREHEKQMIEMHILTDQERTR